jgi:CBS domain-containing protein
MNVETILRGKGTKVVTIEPEATVSEAARILKRERIGALVVSDGGAVKGILSERDIVSGLGDPTRRSRLLESPVSTLMTRDVVTCTPTDSVQKCMVLMTEHHIRHLPVMNDGDMVGVVSIGDVVKNRLEELESEAGFLREIIAG